MPTVTNGMLKALSPSEDNIKYTCPKCELAIPVYPGRYPSSCPNCGTSRMSDELPVEDLAVSSAIDLMLTGDDADLLVAAIIESIILGPEKSDLMWLSSDGKKDVIKKRIKKTGSMNGFNQPVHRADLNPPLNKD